MAINDEGAQQIAGGFTVRGIPDDAALARSKAEMYDTLRQLVGTGQGLIWWSAENQRFAVYPLAPDERVMREPSELAKQVMSLEQRAAQGGQDGMVALVQLINEDEG